MLPKTDPTGTRPMTSVEAITPVRPAADPRREVFDRLTQIALGKTYSAEILSRLNDGSFLLKLDNAALRATLPGDARVGDKLALKLVSTEPRPTFLMLDQASASTTSLSTVARMIDRALHASAQGDGSAVITGKAAIVPSPVTNAPALAAALSNTLASSGLFYESHLHQWINGGRPLSDLLREPQAKFRSDAGAQSASSAAGDMAAKNSLSNLINIVSEWADGAPAQASGAGTGPVPAANSAETQAAQMIGMQLNVLENQRVLWHGELWPGQAMEWEVAEDESTASHDGDDEPAWTSVLRLEMPRLGKVKASIRLHGEHVQMRLDAENEQIVSTLRTHGGSLASALEAAGSTLESLTVMQDGPA